MVEVKNAEPQVHVKRLEWVPVVEGGRDIQSITEFGTYTISVDSSFGEWFLRRVNSMISGGSPDA